MPHAPLPARTLLALVAGVFPAANAAADAGEGGRGRAASAHANISQPAAQDARGARSDGADGALDGLAALVPARCAPFAVGSDMQPGSEHAWRQLLSLAACVQDGSVEEVDGSGELGAVVEELSGRLALPMKIYLAALEHGDAPIQLRAAFQVGMTYVALSTRVRSGIAAPPESAASAAAARRHRELHARVELLLVPARRAAWVAFRAIDAAAEEDGVLARDEIERYMVRAARQMLPALRDAAPADPRTLLVQHPAGSTAPVAAPVAAPVIAAAR
jgi:hypothetical protein